MTTPQEQALIAAALNLAGATKSAAALLPIPNTSPQLYVAYGAAEKLRELAEDVLVAPFVGADTGLPPVKPPPAEQASLHPAEQTNFEAAIARLNKEMQTLDLAPGSMIMCGECRKAVNVCACRQTTDGPGQPGAAPEAAAEVVAKHPNNITSSAIDPPLPVGTKLYTKQVDPKKPEA